MENCKNCKYARRACNEDYIGCIAAYPEADDADDIIKYLINFYQRKDLATGWVYIKCAPDKKDLFGLSARGIPVFKPDDCCKHYEERRN